MSAETFYENLKRNYENDLQFLQADEKLVPIYYICAGEALVVNDMGYSNPDLIWFHGYDLEQRSCTILVNVASAHLILKVMKLEKPQDHKKIGFAGQRGINH